MSLSINFGSCFCYFKPTYLPHSADKNGNSSRILEAHVKENKMDVRLSVGSQVVDEIIDSQYIGWGEHKKL
jgi:hypothetical protein